MYSVVKSIFQDKKWRLTQKWYINGKRNECEKYQKQVLSEHIKYEIKFNTKERINIRSLKIIKIDKPLKLIDGFDYTEDFDGKFIKNDITYYLNLKFICENGGAQTRSLREVYHFIEAQLKILKRNKKIYFINILDGNFCNEHQDKFNYLLKYYDIENNNNIYIGDLYNFLKTL